MYTEIDESHPGKENRNHGNMADWSYPYMLEDSQRSHEVLQ